MTKLLIGKVDGVDTDLQTLVQQNVEHEFYLFRTNNWWAVEVPTGPTGYESFCLNDGPKYRLGELGWTACAGSIGRYHKLHFSGQVMSQILSKAFALVSAMKGAPLT